MRHIAQILILLTLCALITACGFRPMHSTASKAALADIKIELEGGDELVDEQAGFFVAQRLQDRIGTASAAKHILKITPDARRRQIGLTDQDVATRYDTSLVMKYELTDAANGKVLDKGRVESITTFGAPFDPYGVVSADNFSKQQAAKEVADRLLNTLATYYAKAGG